jgi:DMSO/TMAO reductase YedYZ molybdopterin-dependent catalytic subunit
METMSIFDRFKPRPTADPDLAARIPPGQTLTSGFPVLTYGPTPVITPEKWTCAVTGLSPAPLIFNWSDLMAMPQTSIRCDIHCVTRWSKLDTDWTGVLFRHFLAAIEQRNGPLPTTITHVMQHSTGGYTTNTPLSYLLEDDVLLAHQYDHAPLDSEHGGPVRMLVPKYYFWKSAKWLNGIEFMSSDRPGFWERYGYHNNGDPWTEERFG